MTAAQGGRSIGDIHVGINYEKLEFFSDGAAFAGFAAHCPSGFAMGDESREICC